MDDKRKYQRYAIHWRSAILVEERGEPETIQCRTDDVSISGVSVICHRNIPVPHPVTVYLLIHPGNENHPQVIVEAQGSIVNNVLSGPQGGFRLGIQFTKFARDGKQLLLKHLPKQSAPVAARVQAAKVIPVADAAPAEEVSPAADVAPVADMASATTETPTADAALATDAAPATDDTSAGP